MKHLKKLSAVFMLAALFSVTFTSCIDTDVDPVVEAIYASQADLLTAQATVQNAEAALLQAQAANEQAQAALYAAQAEAAGDLVAGQLAVLMAEANLTQAEADLLAAEGQALADLTAAEVIQMLANADYTAAETAYLMAQAASLTDLTAAEVAEMMADAGYTDAQTAAILAQVAYQTAKNEQDILLLVAQTNLNIIIAQNALLLAETQFEIDMAALMATIEASGVQLATQYAYAYASAMNTANGLLSQKQYAEANLADAMLLQTYSGVSYEYWLSELEGNVTNAMANKTGYEDAIADLTAYIADPSTSEAMVSALKAENDALFASVDAKYIELQVQENKIMELYASSNVRDESVDRIEDSLEEHNYAVMDKNDRLDWISDAQDDIADWTTDLADYAAALALLEADVTAAQAAYDAAVIAEAAAEAASATADGAAAAALIVRDDLVTALAALNVTYQDAIAAYAAEQAAYDAGITGADAALVSAQGDLDAGIAVVVAAQADYDAKKAAFEANPSGYVWEGGVNLAIGLHTDATTVVASYRNYDDTAATMSALSLTNNAGTDETGSYTTYAAYAADAPTLGYDSYYDVGSDDVAAGTNAERLDVALVALTDAEDLIEGLTTARDAAQVFVDTFGDALAAAIVEYNIQKDFYDNGLADLAAAELALTAADGAATAAAGVETAAEGVVTSTDGALTAAEGAVTAFEACDEVCLQGKIDVATADIADWTAEIEAIQPIIDAKYAVVAGMFADLDAAGVTYTFTVDADGLGELVITNYGYLSSLDPDIHAAIIAEWQIFWSMEQEITAIWFNIQLNENMLNVYGWGPDLADLENELANLEYYLMYAISDVEYAEQALASGQVEADAAAANIAYLEALISTLEQRYANAMLIADEYKTLMLEALGN